MKDKFVIKNILGNSQKRTYRREIFKIRRSQFVLDLIIFSMVYMISKTGLGGVKITSPEVVEQKIEVKAVEDTPDQKLSWNDAIREVFPKDEAGKMIRICMKENGKQNPYALNENTNGTYDYSWCQVNSCHKPSNMTDDEWKENLRDPMFNAQQVRKIYLSQGWGAWVVYNKGLVK